MHKLLYMYGMLLYVGKRALEVATQGRQRAGSQDAHKEMQWMSQCSSENPLSHSPPPSSSPPHCLTHNLGLSYFLFRIYFLSNLLLTFLSSSIYFTSYIYPLCVNSSSFFLHSIFAEAHSHCSHSLLFLLPVPDSLYLSTLLSSTHTSS